MDAPLLFVGEKMENSSGYYSHEFFPLQDLRRFRGQRSTGGHKIQTPKGCIRSSCGCPSHTGLPSQESAALPPSFPPSSVQPQLCVPLSVSAVQNLPLHPHLAFPTCLQAFLPHWAEASHSLLSSLSLAWPSPFQFSFQAPPCWEMESEGPAYPSLNIDTSMSASVSLSH